MATMTSKGQVTIPVETRTRLHLVPGSKISFEQNALGETVLRTKTGDVRALRGIVQYDGPAATLEEIDEDIAKAIEERYRRSFE